MSNDLISRSAVIDVIKRHECDTSRIAEGVMELPVAYDVDKVVEQLRKNHDVEKDRAAEYDEAGRLDLMDEHEAKAEAYRNAIKIVKSGGIE